MGHPKEGQTSRWALEGTASRLGHLFYKQQLLRDDEKEKMMTPAGISLRIWNFHLFFFIFIAAHSGPQEHSFVKE